MRAAAEYGNQRMPYDAVVIGAGVNGLAAAVHLAAKGWKVAVVERADVAGGAVKTREITRPGFRHDLYAMNLGLFAGSPFFAAHKERLFAHGHCLRQRRALFRDRISRRHLARRRKKSGRQREPHRGLQSRPTPSAGAR